MKGRLVELCDGLGKRIRKARESRQPEWSRRELANRIAAKGFIVDGEPFSVSYQSIGKYEKGDSTPGADALLAIALTLRVNPAHLLDKRAPYAWEPENPDELLAADIRRVAQWMVAVSDNRPDLEALTVPPVKTKKLVPPESKNGKKGGGDDDQSLGEPQSDAG